MLCKACILGKKHQEYENLPIQEMKCKIDEIAKSYGHNYSKMIEKIKDIPGGNNIFHCLTKNYPLKITGNAFLNSLKDIYMESKYPTPDSVASRPAFKVSANTYTDPMCSSDLDKFCMDLCKEILLEIKNGLNIAISTEDICLYIQEENCKEFINDLFKNLQ